MTQEDYLSVTRWNRGVLSSMGILLDCLHSECSDLISHEAFVQNWSQVPLGFGTEIL